jgi:hypothetical protein
MPIGPVTLDEHQVRLKPVSLDPSRARHMRRRGVLGDTGPNSV